MVIYISCLSYILNRFHPALLMQFDFSFFKVDMEDINVQYSLSRVGAV